MPSIKSREQAIAVLLLLAITIVGGFLRAYQIDSESLWIDEAWSMWVSRQPIPELLAWLVRIDQHPPLYYLTLHFWTHAFSDALGDTFVGTFGSAAGNAAARASAARALSAIFGTLNIPVIYALATGLGGRLIGRKVGLLAALILALSPFHVWFAQEARMYALLCLNASLAMLALVHLLTKPPLNPDPSEWARKAGGEEASSPVGTGEGWGGGLSSLSRSDGGTYSDGRGLEWRLAWAAYIFFAAATLWTHNTAMLFFITVNLFVIGLTWAHRRWPTGRASALPHGTLAPPPLKCWIAAQAGVLLLWSPWLGSFIRQATGVYREFWLPVPTWMTVAGAVHNFMSAFLPQRALWIAILWILYGVLLLAGIRSLRSRPAVLALLLTLLITPIVGELLVSVRRPIFYDRTLIWASIPLYLLIAAGIGSIAGQHLPRRLYALAAVTSLVALNILSLHEYYVHYPKEQWDDAARYVAQHTEEGDLILFHATWTQLPFDFYFDPQHPVQEHGLPADLFDRGVLEPKMTEQDLPRLYDLLRNRDRVWLVYSHDWYTDPKNLIPTALAEAGQLVDQQQFYGLQVQVYDLSPN